MADNLLEWWGAMLRDSGKSIDAATVCVHSVGYPHAIHWLDCSDSHLQVSMESENLCTIISTASLVVSKYLNTRHTVRLECVCKVIPPLPPHLSSLWQPMSCLRTGSSTRDTASVHGLLENNSIDKMCDQTEQNLSVEALDSGSLGPHTHCTAMKQSMMLTNREMSELPCEKHPCSALVVACSPLSLRHNCSTPSSSCDRISVLCLHQ